MRDDNFYQYKDGITRIRIQQNQSHKSHILGHHTLWLSKTYNDEWSDVNGVFNK